MTIRGILFDKDGTLTDFHATWMPAYWGAARGVEVLAGGRELAAQLMEAGGYRESIGRCEPSGALACGSTLEIAMLWGGIANIACSDVLEVLNRLFAEQAAEHAVPATDLTNVFSRLRERNLLLGIATMDSERLAHQLLANFSLQHFFCFVSGYDSGFGEKPQPGMVHAFCAATNLRPEEIVVVGDTPHDMNMARNAGVALRVGVLSGASESETLKGLADHLLDHIGQLESILD